MNRKLRPGWFPSKYKRRLLAHRYHCGSEPAGAGISEIRKAIVERVDVIPVSGVL
jgi:hypothetical protein